MAMCENETVFISEEITRIIEVTNFSRTRRGDKIRDEEIYYKCKFIKLLQIRVYPAGKGKENGEFVSVMIRRRWMSEYPMSYICTVSILDVLGTPRFVQSFANRSYDKENMEDNGILQYKKRRDLLVNASELLPNDTLKLQCEIVYTLEPPLESKTDKFWGILNLWCEMFPKDNEVNSPARCEIILLETKEGYTMPLKFKKGARTLGSDVLEASSVLKRMLESPMIENSAKKVKMKDVDCDTLSNFLHYIEQKTIIAKTLEELCKLYEMADEYEALDLMHECGESISNNLNPENIAKIAVLADKHNDEQLIASIGKYFRKKKVYLLMSSNKVQTYFKTIIKLVNNRANMNFSRQNVPPLFDIVQNYLSERSMILIESLVDVYIFFELSISYGAYDLRKECCRWLKQNIRLENVEFILDLAVASDEKSLLYSIAEFINNNRNILLEKGHEEIVKWLEQTKMKWDNHEDSMTEIESVSLDETPDQSLDSEEVRNLTNFEFYQ